jgi:hypothetical protein
LAVTELSRGATLRAAITLAVPILTTALFGFSPPAPAPAAEARLEASVQGPLFSAADRPLYPGGPPNLRMVALSYHGPTAVALVLYVSNFVPRTAASSASCTAADPGRLLRFEVEQHGVTTYAGSIGEFAKIHGDSSKGLALLSPRGGGWYDGDRTSVSLSVSLEPTADNSAMGCVAAADIDWVAG